MELMSAISTRSSIRRYKSEPVHAAYKKTAFYLKATFGNGKG
jgi:hypothetical protein